MGKVCSFRNINIRVDAALKEMFVSEQDGRAFDIASKSLFFCLFSSCFVFNFFRCFRYIMAGYVTLEELDKILVLWCTLYAAYSVHSRCFFFFVYSFVYLFFYYSLNFFFFVYVCICLFITT